MQGRSRFALAAVFLVMAALPCARADEPMVNGRSARDWIARWKSPDLQVVADATAELVRLGPGARPLISALADLVRSRDDQDNELALGVLIAIGPEAEAAVPALVDGLANRPDPIRAGCARALGAIGPAARAAIPALTKALTDPDAPVRESALTALVRIHPDPVPLLVEKGLIEPRNPLALPTLRLLAILGPAAAPALPAFLPPLDAPRNNDNEEFDEQLIRVLGRIGPAAREGVPRLTKLAETPLAIEGAKALASIEPDSGRGVAILLALLKHADPEVRGAAALALAQTAPEHPAAAPALADAMIHVLGRSDVAILLAAIDPKGNVALPSLIDSLDSTDPDELGPLLRAVGSYGPSARAAVPKLIAILGDRARNSQPEAARALGRIGPEAADALGPLKKAAARADESLQPEARRALARVDRAGGASVPAVLEALRSASRTLDAKTVAAAARFGERLQPIKSALIDALSAADSDRRLVAAQVLLRIGVEVPRARTIFAATLREALAGPESERTPYRLIELAEVGAGAGEEAQVLVPVLARRLRDPWNQLPELEAMALARLGPLAVKATPALREVLEDERASDAVRDWAAVALMRIDPEARPSLPPAYTQLDAKGRARYRRAAINRTRDAELALFGAAEGFRSLGPGAGVLSALLVGRTGWTDSGEFLVAELKLQARAGTALERVAAVLALPRSAHATGAIVPALTAALDDPDDLVRASACYALGLVGPPAHSAIAALKTRLDDAHEVSHVRRWAAQALERCGR